MFRKLFGFLAPLLLVAGLAHAQVAVQQNATRLDNSGIIGLANTTSLTVNAQETITLTPPAGQFVYITGVYLWTCQNATGSAVTPTVWTSTNTPSTFFLPIAMASSASSCQQSVAVSFSTPVKSVTPGTAVTFVSPAAVTNASFSGFVTGYYAQ